MLTAAGWPDPRQEAGHPGSIEPVTTQTEEPGNLVFVERATRWVTLACLVARALTTVALVGPNLRLVEGRLLVPLASLAALVLVYDLTLLVGVVNGRAARFMSSTRFLVFDVALAVAVNIAVARALPAGAFWMPGRDLLGGFLSATIAMWTVIRWFRTGAVLMAVFVVVLLGEAALNGAAFGVAAVLTLAYRMAWTIAMMAPGIGVVTLARSAAVLAAEEAAMNARAERHRDLHDTVVQTLTLIVQVTRSGRDPADMLHQVHHLASDRLHDARDPVSGLTLAVGLPDALAVLCESFRGSGLDVTLTVDPAAAPTPAVVGEVVGAVREALNNVVKHSGVAAAVVDVDATSDGIEITVSDAGSGFRSGRVPRLGFGLENSISMRIAAIGGRARIAATARGTTVVLSVPADATPADSRIVAGALSGLVRVPLGLRTVLLTATVLGAPLGLSDHAGVYVSVGMTLAVGNLVLLGAVVRHPRVVGLLRTPAFFGVDLAVAASFALWTATLLPPGTAAQLTMVSTTIYLVPTIPLWTVLRGVPTGKALLAGAISLEIFAAAVNGVPATWASLAQVALHALQVIVAFVLTLVVLRSARGGFSEAVHEERSEMLATMDGLTTHAIGTLARIAEHSDPGPSEDRPAQDRVAEVNAWAHTALITLDGALEPPTTGLGNALAAVAGRYCRLGLAVKFTDRNLPADVPPEVLHAMVEATRLALADILTAARGTASADVRAAVLHDGPLEVSIRDRAGGEHSNRHAVESLMHGVGGTAAYARPPNGGSRIRLSWMSP